MPKKPLRPRETRFSVVWRKDALGYEFPAVLAFGDFFTPESAILRQIREHTSAILETRRGLYRLEQHRKALERFLATFTEPVPIVKGPHESD